ncbi:MAG: quinolinate synthase NadA [Syntrophales bacterium]
MKTSKLQNEIKRLLKDRRAILLVHYYQRPEIQEIADFLGDSLALRLEAAKTDAEVIVFAGVHFMAESAAIVSPEKTVLLPRLDAGCPLADMISAERLRKAREEHPDAVVVTYVNSTAETKAMTDICCTSANVVKVVESIENAREILMVPDGNLARYAASLTGKKIIPWQGYCPIHNALNVEEVLTTRKRHPGAVFAAHSECRPEVLAIADFVGSTTAILRFARETTATEMIVGTEMGILTQLRRENPDKSFIMASDSLVCEMMKLITLEDIYDSLNEMKHVIRVPAKRALDRMLCL